MTRAFIVFILTSASIFSIRGQTVWNLHATTAEMVARLGSIKNDNFADVRALATCPKLACKLLVEELHVIQEPADSGNQDDPRNSHVIWAMRALRYLTGGLEFYGATKYRFGESDEETNRKYWLTFGHNPKDGLAFFAIWPSRDHLFVAPIDAQTEIIAQWRRWYKMSADTFVFNPMKNPPPEKWLW